MFDTPSDLTARLYEAAVASSGIANKDGIPSACFLLELALHASGNFPDDEGLERLSETLNRARHICSGDADGKAPGDGIRWLKTRGDGAPPVARAASSKVDKGLARERDRLHALLEETRALLQTEKNNRKADTAAAEELMTDLERQLAAHQHALTLCQEECARLRAEAARTTDGAGPGAEEAARTLALIEIEGEEVEVPVNRGNGAKHPASWKDEVERYRTSSERFPGATNATLAKRVWTKHVPANACSMISTLRGLADAFTPDELLHFPGTKVEAIRAGRAIRTRREQRDSSRQIHGLPDTAPAIAAE